MNRHQVLTGALNPGDSCFAVGYVEGVPFTAYASGCDLVILASNLHRVQIIPGDNHGNIQVGCIDCSSENGKIAASYANQVYIFEPTPTSGQKKSSHKLDYQWHQTGSFKIESLISNLSWNHDGSRLLTGSDSIQLWACGEADSPTNDPPSSGVSGEAATAPLTTLATSPTVCWACVWQCKTATPVYHLKFSPDGQFFASAGKADRLVKIWYATRRPVFTVTSPGEKHEEIIETKGEHYSFVYIAHPRAVTGFSWRRTSKYMPRGSVANLMVTSCRDNICRLWAETVLPDSGMIDTNTKHASSADRKKEVIRRQKPQFTVGIKSKKLRKQLSEGLALHQEKSSAGGHQHSSMASMLEGHQTNGHKALPLHFHIAATINPNTDIPLLPAMGTMSKGNAPNFVVNWLNNKELQYTLAAETLLQTGKPDSDDTPMEEDPESASDDSDSETERTTTDGEIQDGSETSQSLSTTQEEEPTKPPETTVSTPSGRLTPPEILKVDEEDTPAAGGEASPNTTNEAPKKLKRPNTLGSMPPEQLASFNRMTSTPVQRLQKKFDNLMREWHQSPDMMYSIHPIDGSFLLWLVDWIDEHIPGVHRQPQVSFSCRIPHAFPIHDATSLCTNLVLYRSNLTIDPRAANRRQPERPTFKRDNRGMTPSFSFSQRLGQVPSGVNIYAFTPRVSMLSKHSNGTLNQWEISFSEKSKFQTVLNVAHIQRCCGHRFQLNDLQCHPVLPLLLTTSHHNIPKVEVDPEIVAGRNRRVSVAARRTSVALGIGMGSTTSPGARRSSSINLFGKSLLSESEHQKLSSLYNSAMEGSLPEDKEKEEVIIPDAIMEKLNTEMNWPDMSAPTGLCSELILWRVFPVGPLSKSGGVSELARINSPFISAFAHVAWLPGLLPSSCLGTVSNSPSACFVASDGYSLRLFQAVIDARSLLTEVNPNTDQLEGYLSSSSPLTQYIHPESAEAPQQGKPKIISVQSTARPGCIIELDVLSNAKQNWQNVQLMHVFQQHFITGKKSQSPFSVNTADPATKPPTGFGEKFFLVVMERKDSGQSVMHMWYIQMETEIITSPAPRENRDVDESDVVADSSPESSEAESPMQYEPPAAPPQITTKLKTYSRKVCMQKLELPPGVEVISATAAAGHLSSSTIYPACNAPYLISTACSDGKLRFWQCEMAEGGASVCLMDEMEPDMASSESGTYEDDDEQFVDKETALASYKWDEWKLLIHEDTSSAVEVPGRPIALSCAYNGRIASVYRTDMSAPSRSKVPLQVVIVECESTGGSEWMIEDKLELGFLDLDYLRNGGALGSLEAESVNYKIMKRSSKVDDFLDIAEVSAESPSALDLANPHPPVKPPPVTNSVLSPTRRPRNLPVQIAWVSKEDGSHLLTVGMGVKITIFAPVLGNRAGVDTENEVTGETSLFVPPSKDSKLLAKDEIKPKWTAILTINLTTVDGIPPYSKMLSWVRAGILVIGLTNEMHVYSQWKTEETDLASKKLNGKGKDEPNRKEDDGLSVNLLTVPMTKTDREQSVTDMSALVKNNDDLDEFGDAEDVTFDPGLFDLSYKACPVLPQYHPKQLMELMNCGKFRRVKAILAHLVRCIAGESAVKRAVVGDGEEENPEAATSSSISRALSLSTSPNEGGIDEADMKLDYIELASIPPLPLYALLNADKEAPKAVAHETTKRKRTPTITRAGTITQPPEEASQDYTSLFSTSIDYNLSTSPTFDINVDSIPREDMTSIMHKLSDPTYFGVAQARLMTNYLTHMHLPGLTSLDQMHLLALADTVASTKTEVTTHSAGVTGTLVGREGAGYAASSGTPDAAHAGETLDECGLRYLLAMRFHMCLLRSMPPWQQVQLLKDGLATSNFAWAFHSEAEEELLLLIPGMQAGQPTWKELRAMGIGWWVRNNATLKRCMEKVAKAQFQKDHNPLDAALFYLAMKKKTLLWGLFRSVQDVKMTQFFGNDFNKDRWRKAALKNAFSLLGRQRFEHAAAFFLLAGSLKDAIEILVNKLEDLQLAMIVTRLYEEELEMPFSHRQILCRRILACDTDMNRIEGAKPCADPFLRSITYWMLKDYTQALETLLKKPADVMKVETDNDKPKDSDVDQSGNPDVFNFYNYLRTHPLLVRRQMLDQDIGQGTAVLISKGSKGMEAAFKDEITPVERRLFFATAHAHAAAGCPLLTLEVLSKLPRVKTNGETASKDPLKKTPNGSSSVDSGMIMSGTIDGGLSNSANGPSKESSDGFDWSQPISESKVESKDSALDFDWSQPVGPKDEDELDLKWSDDEPDSEEEDSKVRTNGEVNHNGSMTFSDKTESSDEETAGQKEKSVNPAMTDGQPIDIMAQQLKFTACLKIMMEELRTLATGFEVDGGQLRFQLYVWLEHEVETLRTVCNYGIGKSLGDVRDKIDGSADVVDGEEIVKSPTLHEIIQARRIDLEEKRQRATRRKNWLRSHHHLLRTLFSYAVLYGLNGGGLCSVTMELVLLVQELQQERLQQQLSSPLPLPTTLPLLSASIANCKTVVADPILHLRHFTHDILRAIQDFTAPPNTNRLGSKVLTLQRLSVALSACIYQTLCDSDSFSMAAGTSKFAGMDVYDGRNIYHKAGSLVGMNRRRRMHSSGETAATVTSLPSKWPGVSTLQALLASEIDEDIPNPNIQLCEGLFSVYISFLVHALHTSNCSELFRLVAHPLDGKMWSSVFGGGAKVVDKTHSKSGGANPPSTEQQDASKQRNRYMLKLIGKASSGRNPTSSQAEEKPTVREVFVPPETSIMDYFMVKPYVDIEGIDYDSDNTDSSDDDFDDYYDDDIYDDMGPFSMKKKPKVPLPGEAEHSDPNSYSWCLMRYVLLKFVVHKIQGFLPLSGIELAELPVVSPNLHSVLKLLEQWQQAIVCKLDLFAGPPQDFIPGCSTEVPNTITGPALLRYKGLLDPINTPFRSSHKSAKPAKRLWNFLVRQEPVQDIFITYIFHRKPGLQDQQSQPKTKDDSQVDVTAGSTFPDGMKSQCRIIHKEQEKIPSFCFNQANPTGIIVSSQRGLFELDISMLLNPNNTMWVEEDIDESNKTRQRHLSKLRGGTMIEDDFLLVNPRERTLSHPYPGITPTPSMIISGFGGEGFLADQTGRGTNIITRRPLYHIRRLASHPSLPYYLSGSNDGSVHMWEWGHSQKLYTHRHHGQFPKVTQLHFNDQGNKFGVCDDSGALSLWQVGMNTPAVTKPYWIRQAHNKAIYDFSFLGSSSFLATAGFSTENRNVCLWDTLMPSRSCMVHAFSCQEGGCPSLTYCPRQKILISGNKKGEVCIYDVRQRKLRHSFQAHESSIKCLAVDPSEEFFATGSAEGNVKVWCLSVHSLLHFFPGQHTRGTFFRQSGNGVLQLAIMPSNHLYSCGADGTMKWRLLPEWDSVI